MAAFRLRNSLGYSIGLHFLALLVCLLLIKSAPILSTKKTTWIELEDFKKIDRSRDQTRRQIVQTEKGQEVKTASKDAFLGEKNQQVDRETVNRNRTIQMGRAMRQASPPQVKQQGALSRLGLALLPAAKAIPDRPKDIPQWADPSTSPQDFARGIKESDRTALNTKEFVYYSYYQRIRERLDRAWVPILKDRLVKIYKTGRQLASDMDHSTRVLVILNPLGEVVHVKVITESGSNELDDAAVAAFGEAGPFPNPPKGIVDASGEIQIPWEFILRT